MKCMVPGCDNDNLHGGGYLMTVRRTLPAKTDEVRVLETNKEDHWICTPCFFFLYEGKHGCSQVERNVFDGLPEEREKSLDSQNSLEESEPATDLYIVWWEHHDYGEGGLSFANFRAPKGHLPTLDEIKASGVMLVDASDEDTIDWELVRNAPLVKVEKNDALL